MINYFRMQLNEIERSILSMNESEFRELLSDSKKALKDGKKVIVSGLGKNVPICDKFVGSMISLGLNASFLHTNSAVHGDMGIVKNGDVVIILSKSGETAESVYLAKLLKKRECILWTITFCKDSTLVRETDKSLVLELEHEGDLWNIMPNNSTTINLIVLQGLVMMLAKELDLKLDDFKSNHPGGHIGELLK